MAPFDSLLREYVNADEVERAAVKQRLWDRFGKHCAVFVSDLSGFSRLTEQHSIVHFLAVIHECQRLLLPVIREGGGSPIKTAADNMYAIFPGASEAIEASIAMQRRLTTYNHRRKPDDRINLCVGIGYGDILVIEDQDFFGHELNLAFKLGEDTAEVGEILATRDALEAAGPQRFPHELRTVMVSKVTIPHASILYQ